MTRIQSSQAYLKNRVNHLLEQPERGYLPYYRLITITSTLALLALTVIVFFRVSHLAGLLLLIGETVVISWAWIVGRRR